MQELLERLFDPVTINIVIVASVLLLTIIYAIGLRASCKGHQTAVGETLDLRFLSWSAWFWAVGWAAWLLLYATKTRIFPPLDPPARSFVAYTLSDVNSAAFIMVAYCISYGRESRYVLFRMAILLAVIAAGATLLYTIGNLLTDGFLPNLLLRPWSFCLAVISILAVCLAFRHRYKTNEVLALGLAYALMQPLPYALEESDTNPYFNVISVPAQDTATVRAPCLQLKARRPTDALFIVTPNQVGCEKHDCQTLIKELVGRKSGPFIAEIRVFLIFHLRRIVFTLLAVMKLFWGRSVLAFLQYIPSHDFSVIYTHPRLSAKRARILPRLSKTVDYSQLVIASAILLVGAPIGLLSRPMHRWFYYCIVTVIALLLGAALLIGRRGRTIQGTLARRWFGRE